MSELSKSIQKLLKRQQSPTKQRRSKCRKEKKMFAEYVHSPTPKVQVRLRSNNCLKQHNRQQQNLRLYRRLTEIKTRQNTYENSNEEQFHDRLTRLNIESRRKLKHQSDKDLQQQQNSRFIERIVRIKSQNGPSMLELPQVARSRMHKRSMKSVILPPIGETYAL